MRRGIVVIGGHDGDEFNGIHRILSVLAKVDARVLRKMQSAHDCKGTLCIHWKEDPIESDMLEVESKWRDENEVFVEHNMPDCAVLDAHLDVTVREWRAYGQP